MPNTPNARSPAAHSARPEPIEAMQATGAGRLQVFRYAIVPQVLLYQIRLSVEAAFKAMLEAPALRWVMIAGTLAQFGMTAISQFMAPFLARTHHLPPARAAPPGRGAQEPR